MLISGNLNRIRTRRRGLAKWYEDKITFQAHAINFGNLSEKTMLINEIVKVEKEGNFIDLRLHIHDLNGRVMVLTTWSRDKIINYINIKQNKTSEGGLKR